MNFLRLKGITNLGKTDSKSSVQRRMLRIKNFSTFRRMNKGSHTSVFLRTLMTQTILEDNGEMTVKFWRHSKGVRIQVCKSAQEAERYFQTHKHTHTHTHIKQFSVFLFLKSTYRFERLREKYRFVVLLFHSFIGCFLYVPWPRIKPATLAYWDDALTNWTTQPGHKNLLRYN